jgi:hypothetical protein
MQPLRCGAGSNGVTGTRYVVLHPAQTEVRSVFRFLIISTLCISAALLFGFAGAAVLATNLGVAIAAAIVALVVLSGVFQGMQVFAQGQHA